MLLMLRGRANVTVEPVVYLCASSLSRDSQLVTRDPLTDLGAALEGRYTLERELGQGGLQASAGGDKLVVVQNFFEELKPK